MRRFAILMAVGVILGVTAQWAKSSPILDREMHALKVRQKQQRNELKQQQRATKAVMRQHPTTRDQQKRFKHDMKMQSRMLKNSQKADRRTVKANQKIAKLPRPTQTVLP